MILTAELSLYPLSNDYNDLVIEFIRILRKQEGIETRTGGMSTQVRGEAVAVMQAIQTASIATMRTPNTFVLVAKYLNADAYEVPQID
ncbi:MAG: YkoF family thiamine/hydroxymethylpyrimidine-binding protein [Flavobacteriales bacterium]|jgi:uncharacterized protein YqgV (UPF0045/DUF77 family)